MPLGYVLDKPEICSMGVLFCMDVTLYRSKALFVTIYYIFSGGIFWGMVLSMLIFAHWMCSAMQG